MAERAGEHAATRDPAELQHVYETYLDNTGDVNNWDLVAVSAKPIVGGHLQDRDRAPLYALARSPAGLGPPDRMVAARGSSRSGRPTTCSRWPRCCWATDTT